MGCPCLDLVIFPVQSINQAGHFHSFLNTVVVSESQVWYHPKFSLLAQPVTKKARSSIEYTLNVGSVLGANSGFKVSECRVETGKINRRVLEIL